MYSLEYDSLRLNNLDVHLTVCIYSEVDEENNNNKQKTREKEKKRKRRLEKRENEQTEKRLR